MNFKSVLRRRWLRRRRRLAYLSVGEGRRGSWRDVECLTSSGLRKGAVKWKLGLCNEQALNHSILLRTHLVATWQLNHSILRRTHLVATWQLSHSILRRTHLVATSLLKHDSTKIRLENFRFQPCHLVAAVK
jgi:hypothetical protein